MYNYEYKHVYIIGLLLYIYRYIVKIWFQIFI